MKLYTEEQLRETISNTVRIINSKKTWTYDDVINLMRPIELPSADEILYESQGVFVNRIDMYEEGFIDGAEWVVNKIKGGEQ